MNERAMRYEELTDLFGFDLGDGESCVAWVRADSRNEPMLLEIAGRRSIPTALGERKSLGVLIGEQAYLAEPERLNVRFKSRFLTEPEIASSLIARFAGAVLDKLRESGKLSDERRAGFFIGCPSGWRESSRERYRELFESVGFPNVTIVPESRAAFLFVRESGELLQPEKTLSRPTLIIDAGSSTTDFTYVDELRAKEIFDFGETMLGGGLIDRQLLKLNLERSPKAKKLSEIFAKCPQYEARCELEARKVKELYFNRSQAAGTLNVPCESSVKVYYEKPPITLDISCSEADMRKILTSPLDELQGKSFLSAYGSCLAAAKRVMADKPPEVILLTGGASRMGFIEEAAREFFPGADIIHGAEPEFSIARGLCYALRIDRRIEMFDRDVKRLIDSDAIESILTKALPELFGALAPIISERLIDVCAPEAFRAWRTCEVDSIADMGERMSTLLRQVLASGECSADFERVARAWTEGLRPSIEKLTDPICARYDLPLTSLRLPTAVSLGESELTVNTGHMLDFKLFQALIDIIIGTVTAVLLGGSGVALLMAGPVGLLISFIIGILASRLGTTILGKHVDKIKLPPFIRMMFTEGSLSRKLESKREAITESIREQLCASIDPPDENVTELITRVSGTIESQLLELSEHVRLLMH